MIAHHEELAGRELPGPAASAGNQGGLTFEQVRLDQLLAVHEDIAVVYLDRVSLHSDDALHVRSPGRILDPRGGRVEHDDVAAVEGVEAGRELVHENVLVRQQRVLHGFLLNLVRLRNEQLHDQEDEERDQQGFQ